jgi:hypothetical protein
MIAPKRLEELSERLLNPGGDEKVFVVDGCLVVYRDGAPPAWALAARYARPIDPLGEEQENALAEDAKREVEAQLASEGIELPTEGSVA